MEMDATPTAPEASNRRASPLHIDLSGLPPLITPAPPTNTLLITNLLNPSIFTAPNIQTIREEINKYAPIHTFAPLKSFRRVVVSFYTTDDAILIRKLLDASPVMGDRVRVYFGETTPTNPVNQHLAAPESDKLFFISPPPSPPHGWQMRNEEPPNKMIHADDLATALAKLHAKPGEGGNLSPVSPDESRMEDVRRGRSGSSTVVYHPDDHGDSPLLPAVMVEDTTQEDEGSERNDAKIIAHTARPPVELMDCS